MLVSRAKFIACLESADLQNDGTSSFTSHLIIHGGKGGGLFRGTSKFLLHFLSRSNVTRNELLSLGLNSETFTAE